MEKTWNSGEQSQVGQPGKLLQQLIDESSRKSQNEPEHLRNFRQHLLQLVWVNIVPLQICSKGFQYSANVAKKTPKTIIMTYIYATYTCDV